MLIPNPLLLLRKKKKLFAVLRTVFWFSFGALIGFFFFSSFIYIYYKQTYKNKVYPGVIINNVDLGGKSQDEVRLFFKDKNDSISKKYLEFSTTTLTATVSAKDLDIGYDENLLSSQAFSIGRSGNFFSDIYLSLESYLHGVVLTPAYRYSSVVFTKTLKDFQDKIDQDPINARFTYEGGKVSEFRASREGKSVDVSEITTAMERDVVPNLLRNGSIVKVQIPVRTIKPEVETNEANDLGITQRIGIGTSLFQGSIPNRIFNIQLAASRLNGILIKPDEIFSFNKAVGDISSLSGYKQAYVIQNGRTELGDGGGVCQVSTTLFRALLNAGMTITERHPHAYRVHYYEEDSGPGIDAAIYTPTVDLKFKNDTGHYILIQTNVELDNLQLTFELYGTSDGRVASISEPVILSQSPAPEPLYQDDPNLPVGQTKQIDFSAPGANVYFMYTVTKNGKEILSKKFSSTYKPWQAIFLRGTKT
ncbi:MAG: VanW family protein [Candidatus Levybacteria bacterium]|nr:VanW family protein [Candidatus Levybacteria bacterium]